MEWSKKVVMEFLDLYEGEPCIWNPQNADHDDRNKIHDAWKRIEGNISVDCSINELKKKKENLMATYRKLALKVKNSTKNGVGTKSAYKPEWFAYEKMASFLNSIYTPRKMKMSEEGPENEQDDPSTNEHAVEPSEIISGCYEDENHDTEAAVCDEGGPPSSKKRKAEQTTNIEKRMDEAYTFLKQIASKPKAAKDETSLFCELLCMKLKALDDDTREIAMYEINTLMFNLKKTKDSLAIRSQNLQN